VSVRKQSEMNGKSSEDGENQSDFSGKRSECDGKQSVAVEN